MIRCALTILLIVLKVLIRVKLPHALIHLLNVLYIFPNKKYLYEIYTHITYALYCKSTGIVQAAEATTTSLTLYSRRMFLCTST